MKRTLLIFLTLFTLSNYAQDISRITVNGRIIVPPEDKEGVTVFNSSSNKGTFTNAEGEFKINVAVNDIIEFHSLQLKDFSVIISADVIKSKKLTVVLVEEPNKLDEVVILPFDLTGNLNADLENVRTYNVSLDDVYYGMDHLEDFEFSADYKTRADNLAYSEYNPRVGNMLNMVNLTGFLLSQVTDIDRVDDTFKLGKQEPDLQRTPFKKALDEYSINFIHVNFGIPLDMVEAFIDYVEEQGVEKELLEDDKEMQLLERINDLSKSFLKKNSGKE